MTEKMKSFLQGEFRKRDLHVNLRNCTDTDLFYYVLLFKEGLDLPLNTVEMFMRYARNILDLKNIRSRISELKSGEIGLDDFMTGKEMAQYLEEGVVL